MPWIALLIAIGVLGGVAVACSGESGEPRTAAALESAARSSFEARLEGDAAAAYDAQVAACVEGVSLAEFEADVLAARERTASLFGAPIDEFLVVGVEVRNVDGDRGEARITVGHESTPDQPIGGGIGSWNPWLYEDGAWRRDTCNSADAERAP